MTKTKTSAQKKDWSSSQKTDTTHASCPSCGAAPPSPPPTTLELVGNIACLLLLAAVVTVGWYECSKTVHILPDSFHLRWLSPEHVDHWL
jgi:hypothetical protein